MLVNGNKMKKTILGVLLAIFSSVNAANAVIMTTFGAPTITRLGDAIGSQYDQLVIGGNGGVNLAPGTVLFNSMDFIVGINANTPNCCYSYSFTETVSFDALSQTV